jgi:cbb3-type cytochrome oxidase maturation protein
MTILLVLIPLGVMLLALAIALFVWAVRNGQFEDLDGEGSRILFEDVPRVPRAAHRKACEPAVARRPEVD